MDTGNYICGNCYESFSSWEEMAKHVCPSTGFPFDSSDHLDATSNGQFSKQSVMAQKRGADRHKDE
jgi:hypothetical protein